MRATASQSMLRLTVISPRVACQNVDMREITLLDTGYLVCLLLLSLVLPLMMSLRATRHATSCRSCMKTTWLGQVLLCVAGIVVLTSVSAAPFAAVLGALSCGACALVLHRRIRSVSVEGQPS